MTTADNHIAIIAAGSIGASWAAHFLARGFDVAVTDPAPGAEKVLRSDVARFWPALERLGLAPGASLDRLRFTADITDCVRGAQFVQENAPERLSLKRELFARLDEACPPDVVLASSSSGILPSEIQRSCRQHPERMLVGHPFNPPHLIPLVEVVGGAQTTEEAIARALEVYRSAGKEPIRLRQELPGHVVNRLQAALWREAYSLVQSGAVSVADLDTAVSAGPGLRWALLGPFLTQHLSGGPGGIMHVLEHLGPPMVEWWKDLATPTELTDQMARAVADGVAESLGGRDTAALAAARDEQLVRLLQSKHDSDLRSETP